MSNVFFFCFVAGSLFSNIEMTSRPEVVSTATLSHTVVVNDEVVGVHMSIKTSNSGVSAEFAGIYSEPEKEVTLFGQCLNVTIPRVAGQNWEPETIIMQIPATILVPVSIKPAPEGDELARVSLHQPGDTFPSMNRYIYSAYDLILILMLNSLFIRSLT